MTAAFASSVESWESEAQWRDHREGAAIAAVSGQRRRRLFRRFLAASAGEDRRLTQPHTLLTTAISSIRRQTMKLPASPRHHPCLVSAQPAPMQQTCWSFFPIQTISDAEGRQGLPDRLLPQRTDAASRRCSMPVTRSPSPPQGHGAVIDKTSIDKMYFGGDEAVDEGERSAA